MRHWPVVTPLVFAVLLIAPQTTEFWTKVAILGSLTIVCAVRPFAIAIRARAGGTLDRRTLATLGAAGAVGFVGLVASLLQGGVTRRLPPLMSVRVGVLACLASFILLGRVETVGGLYAAATCLAVTSATVVTGLNALSSFEASENERGETVRHPSEETRVVLHGGEDREEPGRCEVGRDGRGGDLLLNRCSHDGDPFL